MTSKQYDKYHQKVIEDISNYKENLHPLLDKEKIDFINKEFFIGYYNNFYKPPYRLIYGYIKADFTLLSTNKYYKDSLIPSLPCKVELPSADMVDFIFKYEFSGPITELTSTYIDYNKNHIYEDEELRNTILNLYQRKYNDYLKIDNVYRELPFEHVILMIENIKNKIFNNAKILL